MKRFLSVALVAFIAMAGCSAQPDHSGEAADPNSYTESADGGEPELTDEHQVP